MGKVKIQIDEDVALNLIKLKIKLGDTYSTVLRRLLDGQRK